MQNGILPKHQEIHTHTKNKENIKAIETERIA